MSGLLNYLNLLTKDANVLAAHNSDPQAAMSTYGLTPEEQAAFLSGNQVKVAQLVGISSTEYHAIDSIEYGPFP